MSLFAFWAYLSIVLLLLELFTPGNLISIWFLPGTIHAAVLAYFGQTLFAQCTALIILSITVIVFTKMFSKKEEEKAVTNEFGINALIGKYCIAADTIDPLTKTGFVRINGTEWSCLSRDGIEIPKGQIVYVSAILGNTLIVAPVKRIGE